MRGRCTATSLAAALMLASCATQEGNKTVTDLKPAASPIASAEAAWPAEPITLDGRLDEPVWRQAPAHPLRIPASGAAPQEPGTVRFAWSATHFYAAFEFTDRDVVQENDEDQQHHYRSGDVAELFLKPAGAAHYWEFYATPNGRKSAFFFPGRGRLGLASNFAYQSGIEVAAHVRGTLNDWRDDDESWTAEVAIPLEELAAAGVPLDPQHPWTVLAARYNYGRHLTTSGPELSSFPGLSRVSFHLHEEYAPIVLNGGPR